MTWSRACRNGKDLQPRRDELRESHFFPIKIVTISTLYTSAFCSVSMVEHVLSKASTRKGRNEALIVLCIGFLFLGWVKSGPL
jgi:hypothetical protein